MKAHIAVYGALRSGTTMLRLMLDAHPALICPGETDFIFEHLTGADTCDAEALEADWIYRNFRSRHGAPAGFTPDGFLAHIGAGGQTGVLMLHRCLDQVLRLYPDMRFIHFQRDPRDVARSSIGMGWAGTVYHGLDHWLETEGDWARLAGRLPADQVLRVGSEELIADPEGELRRVCAFCGVDYDPVMLNYDTASTYEKPDPSLTYQWKRKQSQREVELVELRAGPLLEAAGYTRAHPGARPPGALEKAALAWRNKRGVWAHRIARYGLRDPLIVAFGSRLGLTGMAAAAQRRMEDRLQAYLK